MLGESYRGHSPSPILNGGGVPLLGAGTSVSKKSTFLSKKSPRLPKVPRPERVAIIFEAVKRGLKLVLFLFFISILLFYILYNYT